tara:strand:- start:825 stop:1718 length:894 start_codon:yes stop_codon:yes gene_type:complete
MIYSVNLGSLTKIFYTNINYSKKDIILQHYLIYNIRLAEEAINKFYYIPNELIKDNYLKFQDDEKFKKLKTLSELYNYFMINEETTKHIYDSNTYEAYQPNNNVCEVNSSTKLILDENNIKLNILFNKTTMKLYHYNKDRITGVNLNMEMFPEMTYLDEYTFNMNMETLSKKLLNKYYYSVEQVKVVINNLTLTDTEILTYQKLVELFHQKFSFENKLSYSLDDIIENLTNNSDIKVKEFYQICLTDFLETNKVKMSDDKYLLSPKTQFKEISKDKPINTNEFDKMVNQKLLDRQNN